MTILEGKGVSKGIASGKISYYKSEKTEIKKYKIDDVEAELNRFKEARLVATANLEVLYQEALERLGNESALIFQIQDMMVNDPDFISMVNKLIEKEKTNCEYAIDTATKHFSEMFINMDNSYMQARANDVIDASNKLLDVLIGERNALDIISEPAIICTRDLMPSETIRLDRELLLGFATNEGSSNSHTAILLRIMGIPYVINIHTDFAKLNGKDVILDGNLGKLYIEPDEATIKEYENKRTEYAQRFEVLKKLIGKPNITKDGKQIEVFANIGMLEDISAVLKNDAGGVGLFRSEFLYLGKTSYPSENEQFKAYCEATKKMEGKKVIIRTFDIGADKKIDYFNLPQEENPAMGYRAIRICLNREGIFKTQLRAILRASAFGKVAIIFPMVISIEEIIKIKKIVGKVKSELRAESINFDENIELGVMIETPASAIISDLIVKEVDFLSIGTNDLTQHTLAMDRQNQKLENMYNPYHKAIFRLIKLVCDNAHLEGKKVAICGELGGDLALTELFIALGVDELSVTPSKVLEIRERIRDIKIDGDAEDILKHFL